MLEGLSARSAITLMGELKVTVKQYLLLVLLYLDREEGHGRLQPSGTAIAKVYQYSEQIEKWTPAEIDDLVRKGLLIDANPVADGQKPSYPDHFVVSDQFIELVFKKADSFEEFWEAYPSFVNNFDDARGPMIPLKAAVMEEVEDLYHKRVRTREKHRQVMESLEWGKKNGLINMNILKYVGSAMYDQHQSLRRTSAQGITEHRTI
jgi:hypothetical protein